MQVTQCYYEDGFYDTRVFLLEDMTYEHSVQGHAVIIDKHRWVWLKSQLLGYAVMSLNWLQYNTGGTWLQCKCYCVWRHKDPGWPLIFNCWPLINIASYDCILYRLGKRVHGTLELNWTQFRSRFSPIDSWAWLNKWEGMYLLYLLP